jgi:PAS domain S-box-containing protein
MLTLAEYRALVERAPMLIWRAGTDALCDYFNEGWLEFTGRSLAQELGDGWAEGVHPADLERCVSIYREHFGRRASFEMEYRLRRHDGAWRWITDRGTPFWDEQGAFAGYIGSCVDVTERVEAQAAEAARRQAEIARLTRLLPLCAWCKKMRTDAGYWTEIESYLHDAGLAHVTHGICEDCARTSGWEDAAESVG